jgi:hypothetical protein
MTRHSFLLDRSACLADLLRIDDLRTMARCLKVLPRPVERELRRRDSLVCFLKPELSLGRGETEEGEGEKEDEGR